MTWNCGWSRNVSFDFGAFDPYAQGKRGFEVHGPCVQDERWLEANPIECLDFPDAVRPERSAEGAKSKGARRRNDHIRRTDLSNAPARPRSAHDRWPWADRAPSCRRRPCAGAAPVPG